MNEIAVQFGTWRHLTGVLSCRAAAQTRAVTTPTPPIGVVLTNAGFIHHVGPHRWHVKLARHLSGLGFPVLRMDLSGLGDSGMPPDALPHADQAVADLHSAMDYMTQTLGIEAFILAGICSGAANAFNTACADTRVVGAWMMDEFFYPTSWTTYHFWKRKLRRMGVRGFLHRIPHIPKRLRAGLSEPRTEAQSNHAPGADEFARDLSRLVDRGVRACFVYSGCRLDSFSYREQLADRFGARVRMDAVDVQFLPHVDHTLTTLSSQSLLIEQMSRWCSEIVPRLVPIGSSGVGDADRA
jgi:pimeloyl-ACP methyl ester carboxylesterase